jgi:hypothetical protein
MAMALASLCENWRLAGGRARAQLHDRHHDAERIARGTSQPDARRTEARSLAAVARRSAGRRAELKALLAPYPADDMICWPVGARVGNVKNNDPSLIEPVAVA